MCYNGINMRTSPANPTSQVFSLIFDLTRKAVFPADNPPYKMRMEGIVTRIFYAFLPYTSKQVMLIFSGVAASFRADSFPCDDNG